MDARQQRGLEIAARMRVTFRSGYWLVPSASGPGSYRVDPSEENPSCTCKDFETTHRPCKHVFACRYTLERQYGEGPEFPPVTDPEEPPAHGPRKTYPQAWSLYNEAQTGEKDEFMGLLHELCSGLPELPRATGRPRFPFGQAVYCAVLKQYVTLSARRFTCDVKLARERGYLSKPPHFNTVLGILENPEATPFLRELVTRSALPLQGVETKFGQDSTGFSTLRYSRWLDVRSGKVEQTREWIKLHGMTGTTTHVIVAAHIGDEHDAQMLPPLAKKTAEHFRMDEVSGDKAFCTYENHEVVEQLGGVPYFAFKRTATGVRGGVFERMFHLFCLHRDEFLKSYHRRSNCESAFSMLKRKFGSFLRSKSDTALINELLARVVAHNLCCVVACIHELGITPLFQDLRSIPAFATGSN